jgi:hypothetical protein
VGRVLLVCRLAARDLRRRPLEAALLLLAITAATATLTLGLALSGVTKGPSARTTTPMIQEPTPLGHVMIRCAESGEGVPASGEGVPRGTRIDAASLKRSNLTEQTFRCPHCGHEHTWSAKDAWVEYVY